MSSADDHREVEPRRLRRPAELAPRPAEVLRERVPAGQRGLERRSERRRDDADDRERERELAARLRRPAARSGESVRHLDRRRQQHDRGAPGDRDRQQAAEREADEHVEPVTARGPSRSSAPRPRPTRRRTPRTASSPRRTARPRRTSRWRRARPRAGLGRSAWSQRSPQSGQSRNSATANTIERSAPAARSRSPDRELRPARSRSTRRTRRPGSTAGGSTLVASCSASATPPISAVTVSRLMRNEAARLAPRGARTEALADDLERRPPAHGGDPPGHLGEQADADHADDARPRRAPARTGSRRPRSSPGRRCRRTRRSR